MKKLRLEPRDLINVGIFTSLYFAAMLVVVVFGVTNPFLLALGLVVSLFTGGIVYMVLLTRTLKFGMITIMGLIIGGLMLVVSHPIITFAVIALAALFADIIANVPILSETKRAVISYVVFASWYIGPMIPLFMKGIVPVAKEGTKNHAASFAPFVSEYGFPIFIIALFICSAISGIAAQRLVVKHFKRAGVA